MCFLWTQSKSRRSNINDENLLKSFSLNFTVGGGGCGEGT